MLFFEGLKISRARDGFFLGVVSNLSYFTDVWIVPLFILLSVGVVGTGIKVNETSTSVIEMGRTPNREVGKEGYVRGRRDSMKFYRKTVKVDFLCINYD